MRVVFEVYGDRQISREILRVGDRAQDARPVLESIASFMIEETAQQFASEGAHASGGWAPLQGATVAAKRAKGQSLRILEATGAMRSSFTERDDPNQILRVTSDELEYGSALPYARYHQTGTRRMPRRRPVEFTETARREILKRLQRYFVTGEVAA